MLVLQIGIIAEGGGGRLQNRVRVTVWRARYRTPAGQPFDARLLQRMIDGLHQPALDAGIQQHTRLRGGHQPGNRLDELLRLRTLDHEGQPRICAKLAGAERHRLREALRDLLAALGQRAGQDDQRVDAAHLRVDRDRDRALRRRVEQGASAA